MTTATLILPRFRDNGKGPSNVHKLMDWEDYIARRFGGCYVADAKGFWFNGGQVISEPVSIITISHSDSGRDRYDLIKIAQAALVEFQQECIFLDLDGKGNDEPLIVRDWDETHMHGLRSLTRQIRNRPWVTIEEQQVQESYG